MSGEVQDETPRVMRAERLTAAVALTKLEPKRQLQRSRRRRDEDDDEERALLRGGDMMIS